MNNKIPDLGNSGLKTADVANLEYLECCVKEVLRLYPPVPLIARHMTKPLEISKRVTPSYSMFTFQFLFINLTLFLLNFLVNQVIPSGTSVLVNVYSLHRDPQNFPNPNAFIPERFSTGQLTDKNPFSYIPFSAGPRNCIGKFAAFIEILNNVSLEITNDEQYYFRSKIGYSNHKSNFSEYNQKL